MKGRLKTTDILDSITLDSIERMLAGGFGIDASDEHVEIKALSRTIFQNLEFIELGPAETSGPGDKIDASASNMNNRFIAPRDNVGARFDLKNANMVGLGSSDDIQSGGGKFDDPLAG